MECPGCLYTFPKSDVEKHTHKAGTERKVNKIWNMEVFSQTGLSEVDCKEDDECVPNDYADGPDSDEETSYGDEGSQSSGDDSDDEDWESWDMRNGHEQLVSILHPVSYTHLTLPTILLV